MRRWNGCFLLAFLLFFSTVQPVFAQSSETYTVENGDTVTSIADKLKVNEDSLVILNRLGPIPLRQGQVLVIPKAGTMETDQDVSELPENSSLPGGKEITCVQVGDSAEVRINGTVVIRIRGDLAGKTPLERAKIVASRLAGAGTAFTADEVLPVYDQDVWCVAASGTHIINIDTESVRANGLSEGELAFAWANNMRRALGAEPVQLESIAEQTKASFYWQGSHTANGEAFKPDGVTAAHRTLPFGTLVLVSDLETQKSVVVRINDRGPFIDSRGIDLSRGAAAKINRLSKGVLDVKMHVLRFDRD